MNSDTDILDDSEWCAHGVALNCKDCRIERLEAAISESCEDDRSQILDRGWGGCLLSGKLNTKIERLETAFRMACGTISTMEQWKDKHPQDVVDEYLRLANERTR